MVLRLSPRADLGVYYDADYVGQSSVVLAIVTRREFASFYADCPSVGFESDGSPIGGVIFDGESAHIAVLPEWRGRWALLLRPMLRWLYALKPEIMVRVDDDNAPLREFVRRCGWPAIGRIGGASLHLMSALGARRVARIEAGPPSHQGEVFGFPVDHSR